MAVDSAAKRASAIHVSEPWRGVMVVPSGAIGDSVRAAVAFMYSGFDYAGDGDGSFYTISGRTVEELFTHTGISVPDPEDMTRRTN